MDADDADLQLLVTPSFIDGPCLLCLLSGTGEHSPPVTKFTNSRQSTPHKSHPINLPSNLLPADMGIFGCVFVQAQALLAFIHRRICMPLISWSIRHFFDPSSESLIVSIPASQYSKLLGDSVEPCVRLNVLKPIKFCFFILTDFKLGLAESFVDGAWNAEPNQKEFISLLIRAKRRRRNIDELRCENRLQRFLLNFVSKFLAFWFKQTSTLWSHFMCPFYQPNNTAPQALRNAKAHYDLGNELFQQFLDRSMTYSCAEFDDVEETANKLFSRGNDFNQLELESLLHEAQIRKYDAILDSLNNQQKPLNCHDHVLEIGFGWGAFAIHAVKRHCCKWTGLTLSSEQLNWARGRVEEEGMTGKVELRLLDYRYATGQYAHIVAVEMIEAVGHDYLDLFFATCSQRLKSGGRLFLQAILCPDEFYERYRRSTDFIRKHIFPGGHLPSMTAIRQALPAELKIITVRRMDAHYSLTLDIWRKLWIKNRARILKLQNLQKCSGSFHRKWDMYFSLCSALFENNSVHLVQILIEKNVEATKIQDFRN